MTTYTEHGVPYDVVLLYKTTGIVTRSFHHPDLQGSYDAYVEPIVIQCDAEGSETRLDHPPTNPYAARPKNLYLPNLRFPYRMSAWVRDGVIVTWRANGVHYHEPNEVDTLAADRMLRTLQRIDRVFERAHDEDLYPQTFGSAVALLAKALDSDRVATYDTPTFTVPAIPYTRSLQKRDLFFYEPDAFASVIDRYHEHVKDELRAQTMDV